ncbi:MAG TPA: HEAT repeat domain-containing protein, partial [Blastocatellia bacterium]|nr:HEAT repeat domain-containing protein [Blastocatellia bacterium]
DETAFEAIESVFACQDAVGRTIVNIDGGSSPVGDVMEMLEDSDENIVSSALLALMHMDSAVQTHPKVLTLLADRVSDSRDGVRVSAVRAAGKLARKISKGGSEGAWDKGELLSGLFGLAGDENHRIRTLAAEALGDMRLVVSNSDQVIKVLLGLIGDESLAVRARAAGALGRVGPSASDISEVIEVLVRLLATPDKIRTPLSPQFQAVRALGLIGAKTTLPAQAFDELNKLLGDWRELVSLETSKVLDDLGVPGVWERLRLLQEPPPFQKPSLLESANREKFDYTAARSSLGTLMAGGLRFFLHDKRWVVKTVDQLSTGR